MLDVVLDLLFWGALAGIALAGTIQHELQARLDPHRRANAPATDPWPGRVLQRELWLPEAEPLRRRAARWWWAVALCWITLFVVALLRVTVGSPAV